MCRTGFKLPLAFSEGPYYSICREYWYQNPLPERFISEWSSYCLTELARRIRELPETRREETENTVRESVVYRTEDDGLEKELAGHMYCHHCYYMNGSSSVVVRSSSLIYTYLKSFNISPANQPTLLMNTVEIIFLSADVPRSLAAKTNRVFYF